MTWASGRRFIIVGILILALATLLASAAYFVLHKAPSCTDGVRNGGETGVDCGGPCPAACSADTKAPVVSFARALRVSASRTDLIAYVGNPNQSSAAKAARYHVEFHDAGGALLASFSGAVDLPPGATVPVYLTSAYRGATPAAQAFLTFDDGIPWVRYADARVLPVVDEVTVAGTLAAPRVVATLENPSVKALPDTLLVATVFDASGTAIAASQTILPALAPEGKGTATFTWPEAFPAPAARIDVKPIVPLP